MLFKKIEQTRDKYYKNFREHEIGWVKIRENNIKIDKTFKKKNTKFLKIRTN